MEPNDPHNPGRDLSPTGSGSPTSIGAYSVNDIDPEADSFDQVLCGEVEEAVDLRTGATKDKRATLG